MTLDELALKIANAMVLGHYPLASNPSELNIIYIEGMNVDGSLNDFRPNAFDCVRVLLSMPIVLDPKIVGIWDATTHAGMYWEMHRMNPAGAFHIRLGQQTAWVMGQYHVQTALIQSKPLEGTRDSHDDFKREGPTVIGDFGVHHHWGYDYPKDNAGNSSAGCQVGRTKAGHNEFIALLRSDPRYVKDHGFVWSSTVMAAAEVITA